MAWPVHQPAQWLPCHHFPVTFPWRWEEELSCRCNVGNFLRSLWRGGEAVSKRCTCQGFSRTYITRMNEMLAQKLGTSLGRGLFATVLKFAESIKLSESGEKTSQDCASPSKKCIVN